MFILIAEDLTGLGGPMGSEATFTIFRKHFRKIENAKATAQLHYNKEEPLVWKGDDHNGWLTRDLGHVMYEIRLIKVEDE